MAAVRNGLSCIGCGSRITRYAVTDLQALRLHIAAGGIIAYPTESCFGLGCDPRNARAVSTLLALKRRPKAKGLILIGSAAAQFKPYLAQTPALWPQFWPGPYTLLLSASRHCPRWLTGHHDKLAVRVTGHPAAARLCAALGMALVSTSANRAGHPMLRTAWACRREFGERVWVIEGRIGNRRRPSTILDPFSGSVVRG